MIKRKIPGGDEMQESAKNAVDNSANGRVPNRKLFAYAAGIAGQNMHYSFLNGWLFYFCNNILKISADAVGYITSISRLWDSVNDPLIGAMIDRHRFRNGEKLRPLLRFLPPIIGILSLLMFTDMGFTGNTSVIYILVCYLIWDVFYSMQDVALWGMLALSSPDSDERARVAQWTALGVTAGCTVAGVFPMAKDIAVNTFGISDKTVFFVGALILSVGGQLITLAATKMDESVKEEQKKDESLLEAIFVLRHNKTLLFISLARILECIKLSVPWAYFFESQVSYKVGGIQIGGGTAQVVYGAVSGLPGTAAMLAATKIVDAVGGMKKVLLLAQVSSIVLRIVSYFIGFKSIWRIVLVMLIMGLQSIPANMVNIAHRSLMSDSIDYVEYTTGKRTEGITFSMQNFATKVGEAISLFINGKLLTLVGYNQNIAMTAQNAVFMKWQWPMFILGPAVGAVLYLLAIVFVKDDKEQRKQIEQELKLRRDKLVEQSETQLANINN